MGEENSESVRVAHKRFTVENDSHREKNTHPQWMRPPISRRRGGVGRRGLRPSGCAGYWWLRVETLTQRVNASPALVCARTCIHPMLTQLPGAQLLLICYPQVTLARSLAHKRSRLLSLLTQRSERDKRAKRARGRGATAVAANEAGAWRSLFFVWRLPQLAGGV